MYILGIESSCDETSAAVVSVTDGKFAVESDIIASQIETHRLYGGVVPEIAGRAHIEAVSNITYEALAAANITLSDLSGVAVTNRPGLIGALLVGVNFAKSLAYANKLPLMPVNHIQAHIAAGYLVCDTLKPPFLALAVSGGHTSFYNVTSGVDFTEIGGTRDDAAGEAFDKIGRVIGLQYPAGAATDKLAYEGDGSAIHLPSPALGGEGLDFSFSGLKTAALNYINGERQNGREVNAANVAAAVTDTVVKAICKKTASALDMTGHKTLVVAGGVAANSHLRTALTELCGKRGVALVIPPPSLCGDNAAMVAAQGYFEYEKGTRADTSLNASACD